ncbi:MAG: CBS domain-containing protein [Wenzhouxiangella sp.]|nr:MAG: CBS domain-containing protein [Wenzhouxiangella sp.]
MTELVNFLSTVAPFSELDAKAIAELATHFEEKSFSEEQAIGDFPQPGRHGLYVIAEGTVKLQTPAGEELEQRGPGEIFGHAIALEGDSRDYQVVGLENGRLFQLSPEALEQVVAAQPLVGHFLTADPGERLRALPGRKTGTLRDLPLRPPVTSAPDTTIADCAGLMARHQVSCLPIVKDNALVGIVTDRDLRTRVLARRVDPARPVAEVMTPDPLSAHVNSLIDEALVEMMRLGIHHLPVLSDDGDLVGVVSAGDLLRLQAPHPLRLVRDIQRATDVDAVAHLTRQGPGMLAGLSRQGSEVTEVGRIASMITDACTRRLLTLAQEELGEAPMAWAWLAFGSQARMEQGLISDQDNGLLLAEKPDPDAADYFLKLATFVCDGLDASGYVYCAGDVMAMRNWRMSLSQWQRTFDDWMIEPDPQSVMNSSIFFDLRGVAGDTRLASDLKDHVLARAKKSRIFLRFLAAESIGHTPPLGLFRQFLQEEEEGKGKGINLKKRGVIPITDLARVRALEGAIAAVHTEERIRASAESGGMNAQDADDLVHALRFIGNIRLRHQVALHERGEKPNHLVDPEALSGLHRRYLRSAFGIVRTAQKALAQRYQV